MEPLTCASIEDVAQFGPTPFRYFNQVPKKKKRIYLHWYISLSKICAFEENPFIAPKFQHLVHTAELIHSR